MPTSDSPADLEVVPVEGAEPSVPPRQRRPVSGFDLLLTLLLVAAAAVSVTAALHQRDKLAQVEREECDHAALAYRPDGSIPPMVMREIAQACD